MPKLLDVIEGSVLVWLRRDLRLTDHAALHWASQTGRPVIPFFVLDDDDLPDWTIGSASRWWLHGSLQELSASLGALGSRLILRRGEALAQIEALVAACGASAVAWNRCYDPMTLERDKAIKAHLREQGCAVHSFQGSVLFEPWEVRTGADVPYRVFTPFWKACRQRAAAPCFGRVTNLHSRDVDWPESELLEDWKLLPTNPDWAKGFRDVWSPGEASARNRLDGFLDAAARDYKGDRDLPAVDGTSMLSPHLHFGEISPRQIWHAVAAREPGDGPETFLKEVGWREFCHQLLFHQPALPDRNLKPEFDAMPWRADPEALARWQQGQTGYPIVDAGMRQLWHTGWMHNRVRMIVASFLTKHLLIHWHHGEAWFWDTLVDADLANNSAGWQWVAGCGADAAPFFRIFNPMTQSRKFDSKGAYIRTWVPELAGLSDQDIHEPWSAPPTALLSAGITLGKDYPEPMVDHAMARKRALDAYKGHVSQSNRDG